jgi:hypothetical protein
MDSEEKPQGAGKDAGSEERVIVTRKCFGLFRPPPAELVDELATVEVLFPRALGRAGFEAAAWHMISLIEEAARTPNKLYLAEGWNRRSQKPGLIVCSVESAGRFRNALPLAEFPSKGTGELTQEAMKLFDGMAWYAAHGQLCPIINISFPGRMEKSVAFAGVAETVGDCYEHHYMARLFLQPEEIHQWDLERPEEGGA